MSHFLQPQIILLKDGTEESQGVGQVLSNIDACLSIVDIVKTTLGPNGMDKLIVHGKQATISNDGATVVSLLQVDHPAAKLLVDIAQSQDAEVGDGTTSVMVLAGSFMEAAKQFLLDGVHPRLVVKAFRKASMLASKKINEIAVDISQKTLEEKREILTKCAATSLTSKLIGGIQKQFFSKMVVDAVLSLDEDLDIDLIGIKKVSGGTMEDSMLVNGVAFQKTFSYAGFEQQPKSFENPKIILLKHELELKAEVDSAEVRVENPEEYQAIVDAEWDIIYDKLEKIVKSGANIVLSSLAIGDLATQYFADRGIFCAGRVKEDDLNRVSKATGAKIQTSVNNIIPSVLGTCGSFEEKQIGAERYNFFTECTESKTATIILRGGAEQFIAESERSLHDAIMVVRRALKNTTIVAGGGAIDMCLSSFIRDYSRTIKGKEQLLISAFGKALEIIPRQLAENAGFDSTDILTKLRHHHAKNKDSWYGINVNEEGICDTMETFVWEPALIKKNAILSATEACNLILSIDETVRNPQSEQNAHEQMRNKGRGRFF